MLTRNLMRSMDDAHLIAAAHAEIDPLTATDLECELLDRLESAIKNADLVEVCDSRDIDADTLTALLDAHPATYTQQTVMLAKLNDENITEPVELGNALAMLNVLMHEDIDTPERLRAELDRLKTFNNVVADAGDTLSRLAALTTQE